MRRILAFLFVTALLIAQENPGQKEDFYFEGDKIFATASTRFSLVSEDDLSKVSFIEYKIDSQPFRKYFEPISIVEEGVHRLLYRSFDKAGNKEPDTVYQVVIDNSPPTIQRFLDSRLYRSYSVLYGPADFKVRLVARDNLSGVKNIYYQLNEGEKQQYKEEISLGSEGLQKLSYHAEDKLGNASSPATVYIHIDGQAPQVSVKPRIDFQTIDNKLYTFRNNSLIIDSSDNASGVKQVLYKMGKASGFSNYNQPVLLTKSGEFTVEIKAIDNVGNESQTKKISFIVDNVPPDSKIKLIKK